MDAPYPEVPELDAEIARISAQLKQLQSKRNVYDKFFAKHKSLLSPIRRLPLEILQNIFAHCLPTEYNCVMSPLEAPMLLTHVCKQWRDLVFGMPLLWSSLYIPIPNYPPMASCVAGVGYSRASRERLSLTEEQREVVDEVLATWDRKIAERRDIVKEWLARAEGSKLSITLTQWDSRREPGPIHTGHGANPDSATRPEVQEIVALVKAYSKQWKRLEVSAVRSIVEELVSIPAEDVPNLEFLRVSCRPVVLYHNPAMVAGGVLASAAASAPPSLFPEGSAVTSPHLRVLSLRAVQQDITKMPARWENLTGLFFYGYPQHGPPSHNLLSFTPSQALDLLALCPNLERCSLAVGSHSSWTIPGPAGTTPLGDNGNEPRHVLLPRLERFFIQEHPSYPLGAFFQCLEMPKLSSLAFSTSVAPTKPLEHPDSDDSDDDGNGPVAGPAMHPNNQQILGMIQANLNLENIPPNHPLESSLVVLLRNCGHTLKRLEFDYHSQTQANLRQCLELAENVERLSLNVANPAPGMGSRIGMYSFNDREREHAPAYMGNAFFRELIPRLEKDEEGEQGPSAHMDGGKMSDSGCLCPNLTHFSVKLTTAELSEESLLEFVRVRRHVKARRLGIARLKKVKVSFAMDNKKRKTKVDAVRKRVAGAASGDEKSENDDDTAEGSGGSKSRETQEDALARSIASLLCRKVKRKPPAWDLLDTLKDQDDLDLDGFEAEVSFPGSEGRGFMMLPARLGMDGMWSPRWGLQSDATDSSLFPMSVGYLF